MGGHGGTEGGGAAPAAWPIPDPMRTRWQTVVNLIAEMTRVPVALITHVQETEAETVVASTGKANPFRTGDRGPRDPGLYYEQVVAERQPLLVPDASTNPAWQAGSVPPLGLVAYLGVPLQWQTAASSPRNRSAQAGRGRPRPDRPRNPLRRRLNPGHPFDTLPRTCNMGGLKHA